MTDLKDSWQTWVPSVERPIIERLCKDILERGYLITIWDGEENSLISSGDIQDIIENVGHTEVTVVNVMNIGGALQGWIVLIHGNEDDVLSDHSIGTLMQSIVDKSEKENPRD